MTENVKKLYRSTTDRMVAGICGGLGDYFAIDSTLVRLIFVVGSIFSFSGLFWLYIIMLIIVPEATPAAQAVVAIEPEAAVAATPPEASPEE